MKLMRKVRFKITSNSDFFSWFLWVKRQSWVCHLNITNFNCCHIGQKYWVEGEKKKGNFKLF